MEKRERGSNIMIPLILRLFESGTKGKGIEISMKKIKIKKMGPLHGEEYEVIGNFIHPGMAINLSLSLIPASRPHPRRRRKDVWRRCWRGC